MEQDIYQDASRISSHLENFTKDTSSLKNPVNYPKYLAALGGVINAATLIAKYAPHCQNVSEFYESANQELMFPAVFFGTSLVMHGIQRYIVRKF